MSKPINRVTTALALMFIIPFAAGVVHADEPANPPKPAEKMAAPAADKASETAVAVMASKAIPPPTIDTNNDGKPDAWDRDSNGLPDAWDVNSDGKPDLFDDNGDGKPDDKKAPPPPSDDDGKPDQ